MKTRLTSAVLVAASVFGWVMVALVTLLYFPIVFVLAVALLPWDRDRKTAHAVCSAWARTILAVSPIMRIRIEGMHLLERARTYVLVANHQSALDILAVLHLNHPFKFVAKKSLFYVPFMGWALFLVGYIPLVRGDRESGKKVLDLARRYLESGASVLLFPEGTRSPDGSIREFKPGAFRLAAETSVPIVPIVINGTRDVMAKGRRIIKKRAAVVVQIGPPVIAAGTDAKAVNVMAQTVRSEMVERLEALRSLSLT